MLSHEDFGGLDTRQILLESLNVRFSLCRYVQCVIADVLPQVNVTHRDSISARLHEVT